MGDTALQVTTGVCRSKRVFSLRLQIDQIGSRVLGWGRSKPGFLRLEVWGGSVRGCAGLGICEVVAGEKGRWQGHSPSELSCWFRRQGLLWMTHGSASKGAWRPE